MIQTGLQSLFSEELSLLAKKRIGLLCHPASIDQNYTHIVELLFKHPKINLTTIFSPQHGLKGEKQDNMIESIHGIDELTQLPFYSLYSETRMPTPEMLQNIDVLVIDLQDVGTRVYTFIYTMAYCMQACKTSGKEVIVLDRPNPINAEMVEGNILDLALKSFVGGYPIPMRHGMTIGELAFLFNEEFDIGCALQVVKMRNYRRDMWYDETELPWIYPSPNMPTLNSAILYPGMVLFEGTTLSEGRGTTLPFELIGAPYINPYELKEKIDSYNLPGVMFRPLYFEPTFHKYSQKVCGGVQIHVIERNIFKPYLTGLALLQSIKSLYPNDFEWKQPPYEYEYVKLPIDLLIGDQNIRKNLDAKQDIYYIEKHWINDLMHFSEKRKRVLLY